MDTYNALYALPADARAHTESIQNPLKDDVQDAWVKTLAAIKRRGEIIENAQTEEELRKAFKDQRGIVTQNYKNAVVDRLRRDLGATNSPNKQAIMAMFTSIDEASDHDESWVALVEDTQAQVPFRSIEDMSEITSYLHELSPEHRKILKRFIYAWALQEAGYEIPRPIMRRISRDRKKINLPLQLKRGPKN